MSNAKETVERYIAAWNERDAGKRRALIAMAWTEDANYTDPARTGDGHEGISKMIATVHEHFNDAYRFSLKDGVDAYSDRVRFQWEAGGTKDAPLHFVGTDFGVLASDGRLKAVTGFTDESPNTPPRK
jgi:nuclear transport factor 2 (NTF2) superfamily protein